MLILQKFNVHVGIVKVQIITVLKLLALLGNTDSFPQSMM